MNENSDEFEGRDTCTGRFSSHENKPNRPRENYGIPLIQKLLPTLLVERIEREAQRRIYMEKYGVQVDKKKRDETKKGLGEKTAGVDDPNVNVPKDPDKGTEPFEKDPENG